MHYSSNILFLLNGNKNLHFVRFLLHSNSKTRFYQIIKRQFVPRSLIYLDIKGCLSTDMTNPHGENYLSSHVSWGSMSVQPSILYSPSTANWISFHKLCNTEGFGGISSIWSYDHMVYLKLFVLKVNHR